MADVREETWTLTAFPFLLSDAIAFDKLANEIAKTDNTRENRYAKAAFLNVVVALECAANCCLARLNGPFSKTAVRYLDKASVLDKYEILLFARRHKSLDTGSTYCQKVKELLEFRNAFVHPKIGTSALLVTSISPKQYTSTDIAEGGTSQFLKLPKDMNYWQSAHSRTIVKAAIQFLNYFFIDQCKMTADEVLELLAANSKPSGTFLLPDGALAEFKDVNNLYGITIRFLTLAEPNDT